MRFTRFLVDASERPTRLLIVCLDLPLVSSALHPVRRPANPRAISNGPDVRSWISRQAPNPACKSRNNLSATSPFPMPDPGDNFIRALSPGIRGKTRIWVKYPSYFLPEYINVTFGTLTTASHSTG